MSDTLIIGGSGLVGSLVLDLIAQPVDAILRRTVAERPGLMQHVAPVAAWPAAVATLAPATLIVTLGTTIKAAGSQAAFRSVDHDLVLAVAQAARGVGTRRVILVSSVGANSASGNFYLRTKGEIEAAVTALGFDRVDIMRPGLLVGDRAGPPRPMERLAMAMAPVTNLLTPRLADRYRAIAAVRVAGAVIALTKRVGGGVHVHHNRDMVALSEISAVGDD